MTAERTERVQPVRLFVSVALGHSPGRGIIEESRRPSD